jgi:hypothetical protein
MGLAASGSDAKERGMHAVHDKRRIDEVHGHIRLGRRQVGGRVAAVEIRVPTPAPAGPRLALDGRGYAEAEQMIVHGVKARPARRSACAERRQEFAARWFVHAGQIHRAVALVAQHFDQGRTPLFRGRLHLSFHHAQEVHLQGLDQKIFGVSAVRTRQ